MKTLSFAKTYSFFKPIKVLYLFKEISCNYDYSAFKKYTVYRGLCWKRERENDPRADGPGGLADTLNKQAGVYQNMTKKSFPLWMFGINLINLI